MQIAEIPTWLSVSATAVPTLFALARRDQALRIVAGLHLAMLLNASIGLAPAARGLPMDLVQFGVCLVIALRSPHYWPLWASAAYLLSVVTGVLRLTQPGMSAWAYASTELIWCYVATAAILCGALTSRAPPPTPSRPG